MAIPVIWLQLLTDGSPARGYWDQGMLEDLFANKLWRTGYEFTHLETAVIPDDLPGAVVVVPARNQAHLVKEINAELAKLPWVILMLTGDEESVFPVEELTRHAHTEQCSGYNNRHTSSCPSPLKLWVMSPKFPRHVDFERLGSGYPPHMHANLPPVAPDKYLDYFFAGQVTHDRREQCVKQLELVEETGTNHGQCHPSPGFTQGLEPGEYFAGLASSKTAPCPSGPETPDTFRLFEALEAGCVPLADTRTPKANSEDNYWATFFREWPPFPLVSHYVDLPGQVERAAAAYPVLNNQVSAWWQGQKRKMALTFADQIQGAAGAAREHQKISVVVPSSPIARHPSTEMVEQTIADIRVHLPESDIFIMVDGIRAEDEDKRADYEEYRRRLLWLCDHQWTNVLPVLFDEFHHQAAMTAETLKMVDTPLLLFVEHDTPLTPDNPIPFDELSEVIFSGAANVIRLAHEKIVIPEHEHLMVSGVEDVEGVPMRKTVQWSQRPHLSSTAWYRKMLADTFRPEARAFIEHGIYGEIITSFETEGAMAWPLWRLWMYHPEGGNIQRSYDLNGREGDVVYDSIF